MKNHLRKTPILLAVLLLVLSAGSIQAQNRTDYAFVVFETTVTQDGVQTNSDRPSERRFYVSNVVKFSASDAAVFRNAFKTADEYFIANVVEPMKAKGISHQYYDDGIRMNNGVVYSITTRQEVADLREKTIKDLQEQNANVFTFNWTYGQKKNVSDGVQVTLVSHAPEQPLYGAVEPKPVPVTTNNQSKSTVKKNNQ